MYMTTYINLYTCIIYNHVSIYAVYGNGMVTFDLTHRGGLNQNARCGDGIGTWDPRAQYSAFHPGTLEKSLAIEVVGFCQLL